MVIFQLSQAMVGSASIIIQKEVFKKMANLDPYSKCPEYESKNFRLRLVSMDDAEDLLECYKKPTINVCTYDRSLQTLDEMRDFIGFWLEQYKFRSFIRFSIMDKQINKAVGTVEVFDSGILPIDVTFDVASKYENEECLSELIKISDSFFCDFKCRQIVTTAVPGAICRINVLTQNEYVPYPKSDEWPWENFYIKKESKNGD